METNERESEDDCLCKHLGIGYMFKPSDELLLEEFLKAKVEGRPLPCPHVVLSHPNFQLYVDDLMPWEILRDDDPHWIVLSKKKKKIMKTIYVFTELKKKHSHAMTRKSGGGTWTAQHTYVVKNNKGYEIGYDKLFTFKIKNKNSDNSDDHGHWIMHEYTLRGCDNYALCKITKEVTAVELSKGHQAVEVSSSSRMSSVTADSNNNVSCSDLSKVPKELGGGDHKKEVSIHDHQKLFMHIKTCNETRCLYPHCNSIKAFSNHYRNCKTLQCHICGQARNLLRMQNKRKEIRPDIYNVSGTYDTVDASGSRLVGARKNLNPLQKRLKSEELLQFVPPEFKSSPKNISGYSDPCAPQPFCSITSDVTCMEMDTLASPPKGFLCADEVKGARVDTLIRMSDDGSPMLTTVDNGIDLAKHVSVTLPAENMCATNPEKPEAKGVSLIELFTPDQVREHIISLKQWVGQSKPKAGKIQAMEQSMSETNPCHLCGVAKLTFEPVPIYCTPCGARIKRNAKYYTAEAVIDSRQFICICCYNRTPGDNIVVDGTPCPKERLAKQKNDQITEEGWVQCDKCHAWQHQICALFNSRKNEGGQAELTCPNCYIAEVEGGERMPLQQSAVLGAKDLPRTSLSDHLEQRLSKKLKQERVNRARVQGKTYDEVPGAECLVIRVVSSRDKKLEVKKRFFETLKEVNYPNEFAYKSKVVLLFQKIEGVEVCLFAMIVQEFGKNCQQPNHRRLYLSYVDSVKYFRPEIKAVTGEDLRTFVYHEILIGYLEHCKKRGFTSCNIWACPPVKGDDYIFHCHPETQKTPKSDKLRDWYISMLEKAAKENIVVELTNLYDYFFVSGGGAGECKAKVTAARLPYFDGDYVPGAAEDFIHQLQQEEGEKLHKKGTTNKTMAKRALMADGQADLSGNASKDFLLMHKLGEAISPKKEDFIMVHLQHSCSHCCILIASGNYWGCCQCENFRLCDKCYEADQKLEKRDRHPINNQRDLHMLYPVEVSGVSEDTQDEDEIIESKFFDTRLTFLGLCEGNHYQYDTLRRAKHSSMMLLYHLHNRDVPAFVPTCHVCRLNIETGQGWHCEMCPDYNVCSACYSTDAGSNHPHKLTRSPSIADADAQKIEARQQKVIRMRKVHDLLLHTIQCRNCSYPSCRKLKSLFQHGEQCRTHEAGGCLQCKRLWKIFRIHAESCKINECHVPRCRDLWEHYTRNKEQADSRGHAANIERMRQQATEVSSVC